MKTTKLIILLALNIIWSIQAVFSQCAYPTAQADIDISNVRTTMLNGGDMWWNLQNAKYEVPKGSGKHSIFAGSLWIGGMDAGGQIKTACMTYRQTGNDFWSGPIDPSSASITPANCLAYDKIWKVTPQQVQNFINGQPATNDIATWPGNNPYNNTPLAPYFDNDGNGLYDTTAGDYPYYDFSGTAPNCCNMLNGDQTLWWVINDVGNIHGETGSPYPIGVEVQCQAFAFATNDNDINHATFYQYKFINRSSLTLDSAYIGHWVDADLGNYSDDYVGCDVMRGMGYAYNGDNNDNGVVAYGLNPPAIGVDILEGPIADANDGIDNDKDGTTDELGETIQMSNFVYYENNFAPNGNPSSYSDYYNYLRSIWKDGLHVTYGDDGRNPSNPICNYMYPDGTDPDFFPTNGAWSEITFGNVPGDRRFIMSAGKFTFQPGQVQCITTAVVWARDSVNWINSSINALKIADDKIQLFYNNCAFNTTGIKDLNNFSAIKISPNPFTDKTQITFSNPHAKSFTFTLYDVNGKAVKQIENIREGNVEILKSNLNKGIYLFELKAEGEKSLHGKLLAE